MSEAETKSANQYLDEWLSSDPGLTRSNAIDLLVLVMAITPEEAAETYDDWKKAKRDRR